MYNSYMNCPSCGSKIAVAGDFVRSVVCTNCGLISSVDMDKIVSANSFFEPAQQLHMKSSSIFTVNSSGTMENLGFQVIGKVRYNYFQGFWEEWYLLFDNGNVAWLSEQEGELSLFRKENLVDISDSPLSGLRVGKIVRINQRPVFITELGEAQIVHAQGQLAYRFHAGQSIRYIEGNEAGTLVFLMRFADGLEYHKGRRIRFQDIVMR